MSGVEVGGRGPALHHAGWSARSFVMTLRYPHGERIYLRRMWGMERDGGGRVSGHRQRYVEDCQVCCKPNVLCIRWDGDAEEFLIEAELE
jgi:hypothetical protein